MPQEAWAPIPHSLMVSMEIAGVWLSCGIDVRAVILPWSLLDAGHFV